MRDRRPLPFAALIAAWLLAGCGGGGGESASAEDPARGGGESAHPEDPNPRPEDARVMEGVSGVHGGRYVSTLRQDPKTFNVLTANESSSTDLTSGPLFEGLTSFNNATHEIEPALAERWEPSEDSLRWTFHLRRGIRWSDGQPVTADDVLFSAEIVYDETIHPSVSDLVKVEGEPFRFSKVDDRTVVIELPRPYGPFLSVIGSVYIMPKHMLEAAYRGGTFETAYGVDTPPAGLVTSGPWRLKQFVPQQKVVLEPNPFYYRYDEAGNRLPYLRELIYLIVPDQNAEMLRFQGGESDEIYFRAEDYATLKDGEATGGYRVHDLGAEMGTNMIWFNMNPRKNPDTGKPYVDPVKLSWFTDLRFRQAVAHALDRLSIANTVFFGMAEPLYGPIPPANKKWYNPDIDRYEYDLDRARRILDDAGYRDGNGDGIREDARGNPLAFVLLTNADNRERSATANIIADDLTKVGIKCTPSLVEFNSVITKLRESYDYEAILLGLTGGVPPDPIMSANVFKSSGKTHFWNPEQPAPMTAWEAEIDSLMDAQMTAMDDAERKRIFDQVQEILGRNLPMLYTVNRTGFIAIRDKYEGLSPTVLRPWVLWRSETISLKKAA